MMRDRDGITFMLLGDGPFTADASRAVARAWPRFEGVVARIAERMTDDCDEQEDLVQEAMIQLWKADPTRFDLRDRIGVRYLRQILVHRMWDAWGGERDRFRTMADEYTLDPDGHFIGG